MNNGDSDSAREPEAVRDRYARRASTHWHYDRLNPAALRPAQERERAVAGMLQAAGWREPSACCLLEVGCGTGGNLQEFLRFGFAPENLCGIELLHDRFTQARRVLPAAVQVIEGDALQAEVAEASQDIVLVSTVFSSLLDDAFQQGLADAMWRWTKPGGAVLWYDFTVDNPRNPDVRGVPLARVRELFPQGRITHRRVTLAPPIARAVCRVHPALYAVFNALPLLRTHVLAWIAKPDRR